MKKTTLISHPSETILSIDPANKNCFDCGSDQVTTASINQGITLCTECANQHKNFGSSISYLRSFTDQWDSYLLSFIALGSNSKFSKALQDLSIKTDLPLEQKYKTYGVDYYRQSLKRKVNGLDQKEPNFVNANDIILAPVDHFPEFENYIVGENQNPNPNENTALSKVKGFFGMIGKKILDTTKNVGKKVEEMKIGDKIVEGGQKAIGGLRKAKTFVEEKTSPATEKIKKGANFVGRGIKNTYEDIKGKIVKGKTEENKGDAIVVNINEGEEKKKEEDVNEEKKEEGKKEEGEKKEELDKNEPVVSNEQIVNPKEEENQNA